MKKCEMFICRYMSSCLVGVDCENGNAPKCRVNLCAVCSFNKSCHQYKRINSKTG